MYMDVMHVYGCDACACMCTGAYMKIRNKVYVSFNLRLQPSPFLLWEGGSHIEKVEVKVKERYCVYICMYACIWM